MNEGDTKYERRQTTKMTSTNKRNHVNIRKISMNT